MQNRLDSKFLFLVVFLALFLLVFWLLTVPQLRSLREQQFNLQKQAQAAVSEGSGEEAKSINTQSVNRTRDLARVLLPVEEYQYDLSVQIEGLCKSLGVNLTALNINITPTPSGRTGSASGTAATPAASGIGTLKKVTFSLSVVASYEDVQRLVQGLTTLNRLVQIDQINLSQATTATPTPGSSSGGAAVAASSGILNAQITAFAFYLPAIK